MTESPRQFGTVPTEDPNFQDAVGNILDDLRSELAAPVVVEPVGYQVPNRPNIECVFDPTFEYDMLRGWIKRSTFKKDFDPIKFSMQVLAFTSSGIKVKGREAKDTSGDQMTFTSPELWSMMNARNTQECIEKMYGNDGHVIQVAQKVVALAGYNTDDIEDGEGGPLEI